MKTDRSSHASSVRFLPALLAFIAPWTAGAIEPLASTVAAQSREDSVPPDTYDSPAVEEIMRLARESRGSASSQLDTYAARLTHRTYVGLTAVRFRRERGVFDQERIGRIRWWADRSELIEWQGMRTAIPFAGLDTRSWRDTATLVGEPSTSVLVSTEMGDDLRNALLWENQIPGFDLNPYGDRLRLENEEAVHPLAPDGPLHYRYHTGDTLVIDLPGDERDILLREVRVEPRRADFYLLTSSLWFDAATHSLVRASYRPARSFNLDLDIEDHEVPGWVASRIEADIHYVTVEYSLHHMEYWLPRRYAMSGEMRAGSLLRIPLTMEWSLSNYSVNDEVPAPLESDSIPGWQSMRRYKVPYENPDSAPPDSVGLADSSAVSSEADEPDRSTWPVVTRRVAPAEELFGHIELVGDRIGDEDLLDFTELEIASLTADLEKLAPVQRRFKPRWLGVGTLLRYNRVEGLSVGYSTWLPLSARWKVELGGRIGTGERTPYASLGFKRERGSETWSLGAFRELRSMSDAHDPFRLGSSLDAFLTGDERGEYVRAAGFRLGYEHVGRTNWTLEAFAERHGAVTLNSDFSLRGLTNDMVMLPVREADPGDFIGLRGSLRWFNGLDPNRLIMSGHVAAEAATGDRSYRRVESALSLSHPVPFSLQGAVEFTAGSSWGVVPLQRYYFLGGDSFRGVLVNEFLGRSYWRTRGELATGFSAARVALFTDVGSEGETSHLRFHDPIVSVGVGVSFLDGLLRLDVARGLRRVQRWRLHGYLDGLL